VSLLPSTTEILFAIGAGEDVVGVTFECDYPAEARTRAVVSTSAMPEGLAPAEIDAFVVSALARGDDLYHLERDALARLDPDLVVTQDLCAVCAVDVSAVDSALDYLGCRAEVLTIDPHTLDEVLNSILVLGEATDNLPAAQAVVDDQRRRLDAVAAAIAGRRRPSVAVLEWTDPPFAPGHWIPEMVELAGGESVLGVAGARSERTSWAEVAGCQPELVVVAACGFGRKENSDLAAELVDSGRLPAGVPVHAMDANSSWARPGTRLVDGVEELAGLLHG
jgi:iron complex transport system substrate-binding protein